MSKEILHMKIANIPMDNFYETFTYNLEYWEFSFDPHLQYDFNNDFKLGQFDFIFWITSNLFYFEVIHPEMDLDIVFIEYDFSELIE